MTFTEFSNYYKSVEISCKLFNDTLSNIKLHEKDDAEQVFGKVSLNLIISHSKSIDVLLNNNLIIEPIMIIRNIFELLFKNYWIHRGKDKGEIFERINRLEASPLCYFEKEVELMSRDLENENPIWTKENIDSFINMLEIKKRNHPNLIKKEDSKFKTAPDICSMIGDEALRLKYYHIYRFTSIFCHPTPFIKDLYLKENDDCRSEEEIIGDSLEITLSYGLLFIELIIRYLIEIFFEINTDRNDERMAIHDNICKIVQKSNDNYF